MTLEVRPAAGAAALADALAGAARDSVQSVRTQAAWGLANLADTLRLADAASPGSWRAPPGTGGSPPDADGCLPVLCQGAAHHNSRRQA